MDPLNSFNSASEQPLVVQDWPMSLEATRAELDKAKKRLERYQAVLRLANIEIQQRNRNIIALTTFAFQASQSAKLGTLLKLALVQALETSEATVGAVILIDPETKELTVGVHQGLAPNLIAILTGQELENGATALMPHLVAGDGALLEDASTDDPQERCLLVNNGLTSLVSLPLQIGPRLMGTLLVGLQGDRLFRPSELCFLMALSQEIAVFLDSLNLRNELWHTAEVFLGEETSQIKLQEIDTTEVKLKVPPLFKLPLDNAQPVSQPAEDDLEQLLAAMMEAEDELQQQNADLQTLNTIAEMMNRTLDLKEILQCAVEQTKDILNTDAAWLYLVDERGNLEMRAQLGLSQDYMIGMGYLRLGEGLEGQVALENKAQFVEAIAQDDRKHKIWVDKEGLQALAAVPITRPESKLQRSLDGSLSAGEAAGPTGPAAQSGSHVVGVLAAGQHTRSGYLWSPREIRLLSSIANQVALAIDNARLYAQLRDDEAGLRGGNEVLQAINDMMLEKNAFMEGFLQDDLGPALDKATQILRVTSTKNSAALPEPHRKNLEILQQIINRLSEKAGETARKSANFEAEYNQQLSDKADEKGDPAPSRLPQPDKKQKAEATPRPPQQNDPLPAKQVKPEPNSASTPKAMSFEEAIAAGLVPSHILNREKNS
jgi:GAF domain-containing protein